MVKRKASRSSNSQQSNAHPKKALLVREESSKIMRPPIPSKAMAKSQSEVVRKSVITRGLAVIRRLAPLLWIVLIGFVAGIIWMTALRFILIKPEITHYHANFAVYINGKRETFKSFAYYEEIAACSSEYDNNPKGRAHMHDNVNSIIHVHDKRVTWSDFFANLDWTLGKNFLQTDQGMYQQTDDRQVYFILNGARVSRVDNKIIGDQDKLLVSFDTLVADVQPQFDTIQNEAEHFDSTEDPASCGGLNGAKDQTFLNRLKRATIQ